MENELQSRSNKKKQEVIFSRILDRSAHFPFVFNNVNITKSESQKYLGIIIGSNLELENI